MDTNTQGRTLFGHWLLLASAAVGLLISIYDYFWAAGIDHTAGVVLVVVSTALITGATAVVTLYRDSPHWLDATLEVLLFLGLIGTGIAAYFLEAHVLLALMIIGFVGWLIGLGGPAQRRVQERPARLREQVQGAAR